MALVEKTLAQVRPAVTTTVTLYTKPANTTSLVVEIVVCNVHTADVTISLYLDNDGSTYDDTNRLVKDYTVPLGETRRLSQIVGNFIALATSGGTLGVKASVADVVIFTVFGAEVTS